MITSSITVYRGEDILITFTLTTVVDITGYTFEMSIATEENTPTKLIIKACSILSVSDRTFTASFTSAELNLEPATYKWDVFRTNSGSKRLLGKGDFIISSDVRFP